MKAACGLPTSLSLATGSYALSIALVPVVCPLHLASPHLSAGRDQGCLWAVDYSLLLTSSPDLLPHRAGPGLPVGCGLQPAP